jgi:folate-binding protein YgfZ
LRPEDAVTKVREGLGWIKLDRLCLIRVAGPQRVKFLHNLLSNDIESLAPGHSRLAALMNLKGHQVAWMRVMAEADALICELPVEVRDTVVDTFVHYKVGAPVRFEKPDTVIFGLLGAKALEALRPLGFSEFTANTEAFATTEGPSGLVRVNRSLDIPAGGFTLHANRPGAAAIEEELRSRWGDPVSFSTLTTLRVEEGLPWHGIDVLEENLLHETGQLIIYHSSSKGCYLGQEVVARLEGRGGHVNRILRGLKCSRPAASGNEIVADEKVVGRVTSTGLSPEFGAIAMGYLHRSHAEAGTVVRVAEGEAEVMTLPFKA